MSQEQGTEKIYHHPEGQEMVDDVRRESGE